MFPAPRYIRTNGLDMAVHELGEGEPIVLLHGFPELAYSWRHQMPALAGAGFRAIAPDQRGYGRTTAPAGVADYRMSQLITDVHGLLDALELDSATFVGHDWGALVLVNFQDSDEADRVFGDDPRHFINRMMRKNQLTREQFEKLPPQHQVVSLLRQTRAKQASGDALLSDEELDYYAAGFEQSGFTGPINWYRNWTHNWEQIRGVDQQIEIPTLFLGATNDVLIGLQHIEGMKPLVNDLTIHMLECGHWTQQERPDEVNALLIDWLVQRR
jgi:pimeloyl-ACP methyl ester carboxylesterase